MNGESWITLSVLVGVIGALAFTALAPDAVLFTSVVILFVSGVLSADEAFGGFSNSGVLTVGALFVVAGGLRETGAVSRLARQVLGRPKTVRAALARLVIPVTAMSTFLNNTPIVAALMPATVEWGRQNRFAPSKLLIPLSYAAILGGTCSLIGTSTNLVIQGLLTSAAGDRDDLRPLGMFEISWIGVPVALFGEAGEALQVDHRLQDPGEDEAISRLQPLLRADGGDDAVAAVKLHQEGARQVPQAGLLDGLPDQGARGPHHELNGVLLHVGV